MPSSDMRQRARNRRRGQRQHVDLGAQRLQPLLLAHAEAVLLVDDHQAEALELHVLGEQLVRADDDVDRAGVHAGDRVGHFLGRAEARQLGDLHRPLREAVAEGLEVLLGQQRRRAQHGHLLAVGHRDERGAQRDFGLAEADVAAHQPVHRLAGGHVLEHRVDRGLLVGRLLEAEAVGERLVVVLPELERVALARGAQRIEVEQLRGGVAHLLGGLAARLVPLAAAELVQRRGGRIGAAVAADQVQLRHRHVQRGLVRVLELQELGRPARRDPWSAGRGSGRCRARHAPPDRRCAARRGRGSSPRRSRRARAACRAAGAGWPRRARSR